MPKNIKNTVSIKGLLIASVTYAILSTIAQGQYLFIQAYMVSIMWSVIYAGLTFFPALYSLKVLNKIRLEGIVMASMVLAALIPLYSLFRDAALPLSYIDNSCVLIANGAYTAIGFDLKMGDLWRSMVFGGISGYIYWLFIKR